MPMSIAVLEGYRAPSSRRSTMARRRRRRVVHRKGGKRALRKKMKSCAKRHKVTSRSFWACVRRGRRK
jgi:hypothetical protein